MAPGGTAVINISQPDHPVLVSRAASWAAYGIDLAYPYLFVADGDAGVRIYDLAQGFPLVQISRLATPDGASDVIAAGSHALVGDTGAGLLVVDISQPSAPFIEGPFRPAGAVYYVARQADHVYYTDNSRGLQVADMTNPAPPSLLGGAGHRRTAG